MKKLLVLSIALALLLAACGPLAETPDEITTTTVVEETTTQVTTAQASDNEAATINIRPMLGQRWNDTQHLLGNVVEYHGSEMRSSYELDTGVSVSLDDGYWEDGTPTGAFLASIWVGADAVGFHFDGLTVGSTYDDVVAHFGFEGGMRSESGIAEFSYLYTYMDGNWAGFAEEWGSLGARFFFNEANTVVAFQWFIPV